VADFKKPGLPVTGVTAEEVWFTFLLTTQTSCQKPVKSESHTRQVTLNNASD